MADEQVPPGFEFLANRFDRAIGELRTEIRGTAEQNERRWEQAELRFAAIENALRDMSEQLVMHSRALSTGATSTSHGRAHALLDRLQ